jgi:hypothetical protein
MIDETSIASIVDPARTAHLCDVGQPDYLAATMVAPDGSEHLVLAQVDAIGDHRARYDSGCTDIEHEQLGALPDLWRYRTALAPLRCGRRTKAGQRCRRGVNEPGAACHSHRRQAFQPELRPENTR